MEKLINKGFMRYKMKDIKLSEDIIEKIIKFNLDCQEGNVEANGYTVINGCYLLLFSKKESYFCHQLRKLKDQLYLVKNYRYVNKNNLQDAFIIIKDYELYKIINNKKLNKKIISFEEAKRNGRVIFFKDIKNKRGIK